MDIEQAIKHVIDGNAMLFLGAGFSYEAKNILGNMMGDASELSYAMCDEMKINRNSDLSLVSNYYRKKNNMDDQVLVEKLQNQFICKSYEEYHSVVSSMPWIRVYTTNYDDVFEKAARESKPEVTFVTRTIKNNTKNVTKEKSIVHLNGYIRTITKDKLDNEFKLTTRSYMVEEFLNSEWCGLFKLDISNADAIIFIGTSFKYDIDLQRILYADKTIRDKVIFIDKEQDDIDELSESNKLEFGEIYRIGVDGFAKKIQELEKAYERNSQNIEFKSFKFINRERLEYKNITVRNKWDLLVMGKVDQEVLVSNKSNNDYIFDREKKEDVDKAIEANDIIAVVIHSHLGNGKTCFIDKYCEDLRSKYPVFKLENRYDSIEKEIIEIAKIEGIKVVVIENYNYHLDLLKKFSVVLDGNIKFILTARTFINQSVGYRLPLQLGISEEQICKISLNSLEDNETKSLINLLDSSNIWSDYVVGKEEKGKYKIIKKECNNNLSEVLLKIVKSESVSREIDNIYKEVRKNDIKHKLLLGVIINSAAALDLTLRDIVNVMGINFITINIENDTNLNELIDLREDCIRAKSAILAQFIIERNNLTKDILSVMELMVINANKMKFGEKNKNIIKQLISISNINEIIRSSSMISNDIVEYFDKLKEFQCYKDLPFFWLQYGMACLDAKEFDRAEKYFKIAYMNAQNKSYDFDTYQIDTQYSRYLLEVSIENYNNIDKPYKVLEKAHNMLISTLYKRRGQSYYIFKQVPNYNIFVRKFMDKFSRSDKNNVLGLCDEMIEKIQEYLANDRNSEINQSVILAEKSLNKCKKEILLSIVD